MSSREARLQIIVELLSQTKGELGALEKDLKGVESASKAGKSGLSSLNSGFADAIEGATGLSLASIGVGSALVAIVGGLKLAIDSAHESQRVMGQTEAIIRSTGSAAGLTAQEVAAMADALRRETTVSDEAVQSGQNMLLTFTGIGREVFPEATRTMLDMAVAMNDGNLEGINLKNTAIQLGKALNDPIKGVGALSDVGVTFTDTQKSMIKTMIDAGDTAGAQRIILAELNREFGGTAKAAGEVGRGFSLLRNVGEDFLEGVGLRLEPTLNAAAEGGLNLAKVSAILYLQFRESLGVITEEELKVRAAALAENDFATALFGVTEATEDKTTAMTDAAAVAPLVAAATEDVKAAEEALKAELAANANSIRDLNSLMSGAVGNEMARFSEKQAELRLKAMEYQDTIDTLSTKKYLTEEQKTQLSEAQTGLEETNKALQKNATEHEAASRRIIFSILQQQAATDGFTTEETKFLTDVATKWGLVDKATAEAAVGISQALSDANASGEWDKAYDKVDGLTSRIMGIPRVIPISVNVNVNSSGGSNYVPDLGVNDEPGSTTVPVGQNYESGGARARGGPIAPYTVYWVGENGPEPAVFSQAGRVVSNDEAMGALNGGGAPINITVDARYSNNEMQTKMAVKAGIEAAFQELGIETYSRILMK